MGLRETFQKAAQTAFVAVGDVPETAYYYQHGSTAYDASAGVTSVTTLMYLVSMVFTRYKKEQVDNENILNSDVLALIPQANLSAVPTVHDFIRRVEASVSVEYAVVDYQQDPAAALWKFQLRKP